MARFERFSAVRAATVANRSLGPLAAVFGAFKVVEEGAWIAMTIFAYGRGGVGEASAVIAIQLVPAMVAALVVGSVLRRLGSRGVLLGGLAAIGLAEVAVGGLILAGAPRPMIYAMAAVAASVVASVRPAVASLLPWLVDEPRTLTTANVLLGWMAGVATLAGPALVAVLLGLAGPAVPFLVFAGLALLAAALARTLPEGGERRQATSPSLWSTLVRLRRDRGPRNSLVALTVKSFTLGCMDVAVVVVAIDVLASTDQVAGWLGTAVGAGTLCGTLATVLMVGRRWLWPWALGAAAATAGGLVLLGSVGAVPEGLVAFFVIGVGMSALGVAGSALLQRLTATDLLGHVFGLQESVSSSAVLLGAAAVPLFVGQLGPRRAALGIAAVVALGMLVSVRGLALAEREEEDASWKVRALGATSVFAHLPVGVTETLAASAVEVAFARGNVLMHQGDPGDRFHVITTGKVEIDKHGTIVAYCGPGDGVGELALLNDAPRNATVRAVEPVRTLAVESEPFLLAVTS